MSSTKKKNHTKVVLDRPRQTHQEPSQPGGFFDRFKLIMGLQSERSPEIEEHNAQAESVEQYTLNDFKERPVEVWTYLMSFALRKYVTSSSEYGAFDDID